MIPKRAGGENNSLQPATNSCAQAHDSNALLLISYEITKEKSKRATEREREK